MRVLSALPVIAVFFAFPAQADSVEEATTRYFNALRSANYVAAAALFDPAELKSFRRSFNFIADRPAPSQEELFTAFFGAGSTQATVDRLTDQQFFSSFLGAAMSQSDLGGVM